MLVSNGPGSRKFLEECKLVWILTDLTMRGLWPFGKVFEGYGTDDNEEMQQFMEKTRKRAI